MSISYEHQAMRISYEHDPPVKPSGGTLAGSQAARTPSRIAVGPANLGAYTH